MTKPPAISSNAPPIIVIFGITGDLAQRYLLPALYHLIKDKLLDEQAEIIGISRRDVGIEQLFDKVELCVNEKDNVCDPEVLRSMRNRTRMIKMDLDDPTAYSDLLSTLNDLEAQKGICMNRLYYLSVPPAAYESIVKNMGEQGLNASCQHGQADTRLMVEKPFGFDLSSAEGLIEQTARVFSEDQVYRIDHFLAKEPVQNILVFRFKNSIFEKLWNRDSIESITITANEKIGIEGRGQFYESLGALRDFIQNHLLQLLALTTMERPAGFDSHNIHQAKQALLQQVVPVPENGVAHNAVRAQYEGYRQEVSNDHSVTETYSRVRLFIDSPRWENVPMTLSTGKGLAEKKYEIKINFRLGNEKSINCLRYRIQPNEGIELDILTKKPGFEDQIETVPMGLSYEANFDDYKHPNAYERVLVDAIRGDHTLFASRDEVLISWRILQPLLNAWRNNADGILSYKKGRMAQNSKMSSLVQCSR